MYRSGIAALTVLTLFAGGVVAVGPAPAALALPGVVGPPCAAGTPMADDFDGDQKSELVVAARRSGTDRPLPQLWIQPGDGGAAHWLVDGGELRSADLNGDVCADALLYDGGYEPWLKAALGTPDGLDVAGATALPFAQLADASEAEDRALVFDVAGLRQDGLSQVVISGNHEWEFGNESYGGYLVMLTLDADLAVTAEQSFEFPGFGPFGGAPVTSGSTVAVGFPDARVGGHDFAGEVRLYGRKAGDPATFVLRKVLTQNSPGVPGGAERFDRFGLSLAMLDGRLAIGVPGEADGRIRSSGLVQPIRWNESTGTYTAYRAISQDTSGVPGSNERDDSFGIDVALARGLTAGGSYDIVIGAAESYGSREDAGSVTVANLTRSLYRSWTQATKGMPGNPQEGDEFRHVGVLRSVAGVDTVLVGAPGEDSNGINNLGRVVRSDGRKLTSNTAWSSVPVPADAPAGLYLWGWDLNAG